jgi:transcriptional regulator with XRE-family HTH domain
MSRDHALLQAFASELKAQRSALKLSQEEFAHRADVNRTYVAKLELAQNQPTLCVLHRLAVALNNELPDLVQAVMLRYKRNQIDICNSEPEKLRDLTLAQRTK